MMSFEYYIFNDIEKEEIIRKTIIELLKENTRLSIFNIFKINNELNIKYKNFENIAQYILQSLSYNNNWDDIEKIKEEFGYTISN